MRPLLEGRHLAVAHLVQDAPRVLVAEVVQAHALPIPEREQRRRRELGRERKRLQAGENAVPAEHGHEPGEAGRRETVSSGDERREAQRCKVDEAAVVCRLQRLPVALDARRVVHPTLQVPAHSPL